MLRTPFALFALSSSVLAQCPDWSTQYLPPGADRGVFAVEHHDDGTGERLYVGGTFQRIGDQAVPGVARWNGTAFEPVGGGYGQFYRLQSLDDGTGQALYAVTLPGGAIFRWNGVTWTALPGSSGYGELAVFDDGSGPALYHAGAGNNGQLVRRFTGTGWVEVGPGFNNNVIALEVFDDGSGPALYAAGSFRFWNGTPCADVARWTGTAWVQVGSGLGVHYGHVVEALCVHDDGSGPRLIAGGIFPVAGSSAVENIAAWDGTTWSALGAGLSGFPGGALQRPVRALESAVVGGVHRLIAAGDFGLAGGAPANMAAAWDGSSWTALGLGVGGSTYYSAASQIWGISVPTGGGDLIVGGAFARAGEAGARQLARFDGTTWHNLVAGESIDGSVRASTVHDDGTGRQIYVAGDLRSAGNHAARLVARFDGTTWERVGPFAADTGQARALASIDFGAGPRLYVGGTFTSIGGAPLATLAAWDGSQWTDAPGVTSPGFLSVDALLADPTGLYVGGNFTQIGGISALGIARFDGQTWTTFGSGLGSVRALAFLDTGTSRELYAAGAFPGRIAHWNGTTWVYVPQPPSGSGGEVFALEPYFDGTSERLFVGGFFSQVGGFNTINIASWNGSAWTAYGFGTSGYVNSQMRGFRVFDDGLGAGPKLFAYGYFSQIQNQVGFSVIGFDGTTWQGASPNGGVANGTIETLDVLEDGTGASLFAFGQFEATNSALAWGIARYGRSGAPGCEPITGVGFCDGSGAGAACPCGNVGAAGHGCNNSSSTGGAALTALGQANVPADTVTLRASGMPATTVCLFFQGTSSPAGGAGAVFGDGIRCVSGAQVRLAIRAAAGGIAQFGAQVPPDPPVSAAGGVFVAATRTYQVWYRDAQSFCTTSTFNLSNGLRLRWAP